MITESSARAARDAIAFADPESNDLRLMRLNSIAQAVATEDCTLAKALIAHSSFAANLLQIVACKPTLSDPASFEEAFAEAKRSHIARERPDRINVFFQKS